MQFVPPNPRRDQSSSRRRPGTAQGGARVRPGARSAIVEISTHRCGTDGRHVQRNPGQPTQPKPGCLKRRKARHVPGRRPSAMDGSNLIFIILPIVILLVLAFGKALPFIVDSRAAAGAFGPAGGGRRIKAPGRCARAGPCAVPSPAARSDAARLRRPCCVIVTTSLRVTGVSGRRGEVTWLWRALAGPPPRARHVSREQIAPVQGLPALSPDALTSAALRDRSDIVTARVPVPLHLPDGRHGVSRRDCDKIPAGTAPGDGN